MIQILSAIPAIFSAISKITELFEKGKETIKKITGSPSQSSTPDELRTEVESLPKDQQNRWAEVMAKQVDLYVKQNERLAIEIGLIDENITGKMDARTANKIAELRMTTRPWTVRLMVHFVLFPFYLIIVDLVQNLVVSWLPFIKTWFHIEPFNAFEYVFGIMKLPDQSDTKAWEQIIAFLNQKGGPATFAGQIYMESIPWVVGIILGYMSLREIGKARGHKDPEAPPVGASMPVSIVGKTISQGISIVDRIRDWFNLNLKRS